MLPAGLRDSGPIEMRPIVELRAYERNARTHSGKQLKLLAESIKRFGFTAPAIVDETGLILAGHGRVTAAQLAGLTEVPVRVVGYLSDDEKRAYVLADNRIADMAGWDKALLGLELQHLQSTGFAVEGIGFSRVETEKLIAGLGLESPAERAEAAAAAPAVSVAAPITQPGDLWQLGKCRLLCGDSTVPRDVTRLLAGAKPFLMVTDPPYGVEYDPSWRHQALKNEANGTALGKVRNDDRHDWREAWALFPGDVAYVWHAGTFAGHVQLSLEAAGFQVRAQVVWVKTAPVLSRGAYHAQHEPAFVCERVGDGDDAAHVPALYGVRKGRRSNWQGDRTQTTVWEIEHRKSETGHGTQKPIECMKRPILNHTAQGDLVYDPFLGSGTTIIAAEQTGRVAYGLELDPAYCDVIVRRWQSFTGGRAVREDGAAFDDLAAASAAVAA